MLHARQARNRTRLSFWIVQVQENPAEPRDPPGRREWRSNTLAETPADPGHDVRRWRSASSHQGKTFLAPGNFGALHDNDTQEFIACPSHRAHVGARRITDHRALGPNVTLHARDLPGPAASHVGKVPIALAHAAVRHGHDVGAPVIFDIRDLWPDIYVDLLPARAGALRGPALRLLHTTSVRLRWALANATAITALTQPYTDWALRLAGRPQRDTDAIFRMCYPRRDATPPETDLDALRARLGLAPDDIVAAYLGNLGHQSDFATVLAAARRIAADHPRVKIVLAGSGPEEETLRKAARDLPNVIVPGWLQGPEIGALLHLSQIGLIAFRPVPNYLRNIPNKFSEYLAGGMAIACGLGGEMGRLTREADCGFLYPPGDADALARALADAVSHPARLAKMGANARALHAERFDGARIYPAFADYLERIADARSQRAKGAA